MKLGHSLAFGVILSAMSATSQTTHSLSLEQVHYFASFFEHIGSADVSPERLQANETGLKNFFGLNQSEAALLHSLAQNYRSTMAQIRSSETTITSKATAPSLADRSTLTQLIQTRDQTVSSLANKLLTSLRPEAVSRIMADAQTTIDLRVSKGIH